MLKPLPSLMKYFESTMCLLAGILPSIVITISGKSQDASWDAAKKQLMENIKDYMRYVKDVKSHVDDNTINMETSRKSASISSRTTLMLKQ
jgi:hypothetical protein